MRFARLIAGCLAKFWKKIAGEVGSKKHLARVSIIVLVCAATMLLSGCSHVGDFGSGIIHEIADEFTDVIGNHSEPGLGFPVDIFTSGYDASSNSDIDSGSDMGSGSMRASDYDGKPWVYVNDNTPYFDFSKYLDNEGFENYSDLDSLGRPGVAFAILSRDTMPKENEERGEISSVKPAGWHSVSYDIVDGGWLYNRCHLIGWQLGAENANERNLITGTRYLNIDGMLDWENSVASYLRSDNNNRVLYRVTPVYSGDNLLCEGLLLEAEDLDHDIDEDAKLRFCVFCYNVQPGVEIDYVTGNSFSDYDF